MKALVDVHRLDRLEEIASNVFAMTCSVNQTQALRNLERAAIISRRVYDGEMVSGKSNIQMWSSRDVSHGKPVEAV